MTPVPSQLPQQLVGQQVADVRAAYPDVLHIELDTMTLVTQVCGLDLDGRTILEPDTRPDDPASVLEQVMTLIGSQVERVELDEDASMTLRLTGTRRLTLTASAEDHAQADLADWELHDRDGRLCLQAQLDRRLVLMRGDVPIAAAEASPIATERLA